MNLEKFQDKIDKEIAWRKKELSTIKFDVQNSRKERNEDVKKYRIKSGIVMLYSHWEGAIKRIAQYYLNYVSGLKLPYKELRSNFLSLSLQDELSKKDNSKATKRNNLINQIFSKREEICDIGKKHKINAKGNLNSDTFKEIMATVGLATEQYESKYKLIDERLADNRNCVAHGDYFEQLSVSTIDEYVEIHEEVQKLMDNFAEDVRNAATNKKYKREKHIKVVGAAIIDDNKVLTTKRSSDRVLGDLWEFPGGKIEPEETPQQALKRELEEEFKDEILVGPQVTETVKYEYEFGVVELTVFYAKLLTNNFDLVAHSEVKWHTVDELARLNWAPADIPVVKAIEKVDLRSISFE